MKKKIFTALCIVVVIAVIGVVGMRICVNYFFDKYLLGTALSSVVENSQEKQTTEKTEVAEPEVPEKIMPEESEETTASEKEPKKELSHTEIVRRVMKSPELTNKMASMVPYEEKRQILKIILSNFSEDELAEIAAQVSKGLTPEYKSQLIATARSRLTYEQWRQCLDVAYKYVEEMRPYVE